MLKGFREEEDGIEIDENEGKETETIMLREFKKVKRRGVRRDHGNEEEKKKERSERNEDGEIKKGEVEA